MKARFFNPNDPISIISYLATFKPDCDTNNIHKDAAMWVFFYHVNGTLPNALNSCISASHGFSKFAAFVRVDMPRPKKLLGSYLDVVNHFLCNYTTAQAIAVYDTAMLNYD